MPDARKRPPRRRRDLGRIVSLALCVVFAALGAVPLGLGFLVRTEAVRDWAARQTAALLAREVGITARYDVSVELWPMQVSLAKLTVDASDGGGPFLAVERVSIRPRVFSLLAGKLDAGDVEIVGPRVRAVVRGGELQNLVLHLPEPSGPEQEPPARAPFSSLAITDARIDAVIDDVTVAAREVDLDVSGEPDASFEVSLRAGVSQVTRVHPVPGREKEEDAVDEDTICRLDARVRLEPGAVLVRRLALLGSADFDPDPGTRPSCALAPRDWRAVDVHLGAVRVGLPKVGAPTVHGRVRAKIPAALAHRFVSLPHASGSVSLDVEIEKDGLSPLPEVSGRLHADTPGIDGKVFAHVLDSGVSIHGGVVRLSELEVTWGDGRVTVGEVALDALSPDLKLTAGPVDIRDVEFPGLMRDLGAHPNAHVAWTLKEGRADRFGGTLSPLHLEGALVLKTRDFEVFDRPARDPSRVHMMGVRDAALVRGLFVVRPGSILFENFTIDTPRSHVHTTVDLDLRQLADIEVFPGSHVDLADISPLARVPIGGELTLAATSHGAFGDPHVEGAMAVKDFTLGGFSAGDIESARVAFAPLVLRLSDVRLKKGQSRMRAPSLRVAFDEGPDVLVDADVDTREAPHLGVRDFLNVFHFEKDPRFAEMDGTASGTARVHYALGGVEDRCGGGYVKIATRMDATAVSLFGERYDGGSVDLDFEWDDQDAGDAGMNIDLRSATLRKGAGTVLANGTVRHGARVAGSAVATAIPLARLDVLGGAGKMLDGEIAAVASVSGTLGDLEALADVSISRVRIGPDSLPPSRFRLAMEPSGAPESGARRTRCGNRRATPFDPVEFARDAPAGLFRLSGQLFDGQLGLDDVRFTRQRHHVMQGGLLVRRLDLGKLSNLIPGIAFGGATPQGTLSATVDVRNLPLDRLRDADVIVALEELDVSESGRHVSLAGSSGPVHLHDDELDVPDLRIGLRTASGLTATVVAGGTVHRVATAPDLDLGVRVEPLALAKLAADIEQVGRAGGVAEASLRVEGPPSSPRYSGSARVRGGELELKDPRLSLDGIEVDAEVGGGEARITRAVANVGTGTLAMTARMPLHGLTLGTATANITARGVKVPVAEGIHLTTDADLTATFLPGAKGEGDEPNLPSVEGTVSLTSFSYTRPISLNVDLGQLAGRARRTEVESASLGEGNLRFNVNLVSPRPLRFSNNLVDMELDVAAPGLVLSGTDQRYGARGLLRVLENSKLKLRNNEFEVREGTVRFDDPSRIAPIVDLRAVTEYRRYASTAAPAEAGASGAEAAPAAGGAPGASAGSGTGGQWRITLHAQGEVQDLKVDFTSDPPLGQEDIVLLLTLGTTRAEIDRGLATSIGETVGLEALSALTGADKAVKTIVPLIDDFRFGTAYSSKSGRIEPTVTVGKRVTDEVRATVTTGLSENREVRSSVEWRLNRRVSVQGSYDNSNEASSSSVGNVGGDLRFRLEFE